MRALLLSLVLLAACGGDDTGAPATDAAPLAADAMAGAADAGPFAIACGAQSCGQNEICCTDTGGGRTCLPDSPGSCAGGDIALCDGPEDCAEGVCCGRGGGANAATCQAEAACDGLPRCHGPGDCSSGVCCPQGFCGPGCD